MYWKYQKSIAPLSIHIGVFCIMYLFREDLRLNPKPNSKWRHMCLLSLLASRQCIFLIFLKWGARTIFLSKIIIIIINKWIKKIIKSYLILSLKLTLEHLLDRRISTNSIKHQIRCLYIAHLVQYVTSLTKVNFFVYLE